MDASIAATAAPPVEWIRKRSGEVVRLDPQRISQSLRRAAEDLVEIPSDEAIDALGQMALFFVRNNMAGSVASTDEVSEWIEKSLRETNQGRLAESFAAYRNRKLWAERELLVADQDAEGSPEPTHWDKPRLIATLRARLNLDSHDSRAVAGTVERAVMRGRFERLTTALLREMVNAALEQWNVQSRLAPLGRLTIRTAELRDELAGPGPTAATQRLTNRIWHEFSLHEVVSRDVADVVRRGILRVHGMGAPAGLAACCADCGTLVRQSTGSRQSLVQFAGLLARKLDSCSGLLAIDRIESWLSLVAEPADTPARLAEQFWNELCSRMRYSALSCVLNLYGGMPQGVDIEFGAGPLFRQEPLSAEREFAGAVAYELLDLYRRDAAEWPNLRLDWHWYAAPDPVQTALIRRIVRVIEDGRRVAIAFEREPIPLGEGLRRVRNTIRPVLDFVGITLPVVWRESGSPRSLPALEEGLRQVVQLAVRGAVQRREFVRRLPHAIAGAELDRAIVAIYPLGLDWTVRQLVGKGAAEDEAALKLCETLVRYLRDSAEREARHFALNVVVDHPIGVIDRDAGDTGTASYDAEMLVPGLVPAAPDLGLRRQIHAASRLHAIAQAGTLTVRHDLTALQIQNQFVETLDWTSRHSSLVRLQLDPARTPADQGTVAWPEP